MFLHYFINRRDLELSNSQRQEVNDGYLQGREREMQSWLISGYRDAVLAIAKVLQTGGNEVALQCKCT